MNQSNFETFVSTYEKNLKLCRRERPQDYLWADEKLPVFMERFKYSVSSGNLDKDTKAVRRTCRELGVPNTYKGIREYLSAENLE